MIAGCSVKTLGAFGTQPFHRGLCFYDIYEKEVIVKAVQKASSTKVANRRPIDCFAFICILSSRKAYGVSRPDISVRITHYRLEPSASTPG